MSETTIPQADVAISEPFEKRILIVDDVDLVGLVVVKQLKSAGFGHVRSETDPRLAMDVIREFKPDMILLDIMMPEISGLEVLKQIRSNPEMDKIIVLMLSAAGRDEKYESLEMGALGFMQKPITSLNLLETVTSKFAIAKRLGLQT